MLGVDGGNPKLAKISKNRDGLTSGVPFFLPWRSLYNMSEIGTPTAAIIANNFELGIMTKRQELRKNKKTKKLVKNSMRFRTSSLFPHKHSHISSMDPF